MTIGIDSDFLSDISANLPQFKWRTPGVVAQCRCILCGDSAKDSTKTRGFFFQSTDKNSLQYKCHNCGASMSFSWFLKNQFPSFYREYRLAKFKSGGQNFCKNVVMKAPQHEPVKAIQKPETKCNKWTMVSDLDVSHPARTYCFGRGLDASHMSRIVFTENFKKWSDENIRETTSSPPESPFLLFPFMDAHGHLFGAQGRVFTETSDKKHRFKTVIEKNSVAGKSFGLERVNRGKPVVIVEGVIDSLLLPNCVALCGGDVSPTFKSVANDVIIALDNESRSVDTVNRLDRAIDMGFSVVLWPLESKLKDINDMIKYGMTVDDIMQVIENNTYSGNRAKTKLKFWKKV